MDNSNSFTPYVYNPQQDNASSTVAPTPTQPKQSGNWFSKILPTAGSIVGGIGGTLLDPFIGPLGTIGGSALGDAVGKGIQNGVEGKGFNLGDEASSLGEGAVGGILGGIGGKVIGGLASKGAQVAENTVPKLLQGQVADGTLDNVTAQHLATNGITSMAQHAKITPLITGDEGAFNVGVKNTLNEGAKQGLRLDLSKLESQGKLPGEQVRQSIIDAGIDPETSEGRAVANFVNSKLLKAVGSKEVGTLPSKGTTNVSMITGNASHSIDPNDALDMSRSLMSQASQWASSSTPFAKEKAQALRSLANTINDGLYGADSQIGKMGISNTVRQQMIDQIAPIKDINPQYYEHKLSILQDPNLTVSQLRSAQLPEVKASQALEQTANMNNGKGLNLATALPGSARPSAIASHGVSKLLASGAVNKGTAGLLSKMQPTLERLGNVTKASGQVGTSPLATGIGLTGADTITNAGNLQPNAIVPTQQEIDQQGDTQVQPGSSPLQTSYQIAQNNAANPYLQASALPALSQLTTQVQQGKTGEAALQALEQAYGQAGGGQGFLGGTLAKLGGALTGNNVAAYEAQRQQAMKTLQALGIPVSALPDITNTNGAAQSQFSNVQSLLNSINGVPIAQGS